MNKRIEFTWHMTPNLYVDQLLHLLTGDEVKVLWYATRHILGTPYAVEGMTLDMLAGVGIRGHRLRTAITGLNKYCVLVPVRSLAHGELAWTLGQSPDIDGLNARALRRLEEQE